MAVMLAAALATSFLFGLFPAWEATSIELRAALSEAGRSSAGARQQWKRQALVFAEVALGVMLVVGAGLLIRTLATLMNANPGFNPTHVFDGVFSAKLITRLPAKVIIVNLAFLRRFIPDVVDPIGHRSRPGRRPSPDRGHRR
jgi:hypothetical protein